MRSPENLVDSVVWKLRPDRLARTEAGFLAAFRHRLLLDPVIGDDALGNAPGAVALFEPVTVSPGQQVLAHDTVFSCSPLQRAKIGLNDRRRGVGKFDQDVADLMHIAR